MSEDWTPTGATRKAKMMERIDPTFYAASQAEQGEAVGAGAMVAAYSGDATRIVEVFGSITARPEKIEVPR
ncbi:hypothetical protein CYMTET_24946 [Cymbomonas tetramitiformis]|uniref:Uncharacterized protein n=1 Tax=Cymbomonas tetramitiformis TaxID=36881 RepID=A0AAE0FUT9_9CHLO|nr:hypothetical protein CYMTET_24946 [Cymbomonas tetramitiformis]